MRINSRACVVEPPTKIGPQEILLLRAAAPHLEQLKSPHEIDTEIALHLDFGMNCIEGQFDAPSPLWITTDG